MKFYDTSTLLKKVDNLFSEHFLISSITLNELEEIKTSSRKDMDIKTAARHVLRELDRNQYLYDVIIFQPDMLEPFIAAGLEITNDIKILATAYSLGNSELIFMSEDLALKNIARMFLRVSSVSDIKEDKYTGYENVYLNEEEMANFYTHLNENLFNTYINEYINIYNQDTKELVDTRVWTGSEYRPLAFRSFDSKWFGKIKPYKGDIYQQMVADSFMNNQFTSVFGRPGSGKTYLALGYLFFMLEKGEIDKIVIVCNPMAAKDATKLGYTPGTLQEKILDTQVGNVLFSKIGDRFGVEQLLERGKLELIPVANIRGYSCEGKVGYYITESQNLNTYLAKLILQRVGEECKIIFDGDFSQIDDKNFTGNSNGLKRTIEVFKGQSMFGCVELQHTHRSKICEIAEKM